MQKEYYTDVGCEGKQKHGGLSEQRIQTFTGKGGKLLPEQEIEVIEDYNGEGGDIVAGEDKGQGGNGEGDEGSAQIGS